MEPVKYEFFTVSYRDFEDRHHEIVVRAHSSTHAMTVAMSEVKELMLHPNRIFRVSKEG